jgi:hypothetical protein
MAVMMMMEWSGVTREQYDAVRKIVNFEGNAPKGGLFHVAAFTDSGLRVNDLWERAEDFQSFVEQRLMPGVQQAGIAGEPKVQILPAYNVFASGYVAH